MIDVVKYLQYFFLQPFIITIVENSTPFSSWLDHALLFLF